MTLTPSARSWKLQLHSTHLVFAKLPPGSGMPDWARSASPITSVSWSERETSVLAPADVVPDDLDRFGPWQAFEVVGHIDFLLTGVLHGIIAPLAESQLALTTISTYQTDWILVPAEQAQQAVNVWRCHGHDVVVLEDVASASEEPA